MAVRNSKLGGTDFANGEVLYDYDLDDTNNTIINLGSKSPLLSFGFNKHDFTVSSNSNILDVFGGDKINFKTVQNSTFNWISTYFDYSGMSFNNGLLTYELNVFECGNGITSILDNYDDSTKSTRWTETINLNGSTSTGSVTETNGYYQTYATGTNSGDQPIVTSVSENLKGVTGTYIIPVHLIANTNVADKASALAHISIGSVTDVNWTIIASATTDANPEIRNETENGFIRITISNDIVNWTYFNNITSVTAKGTVDLSGATDINIRMYSKAYSHSSDDRDSQGTCRLYGIYKYKDTYTSTVDVQMSNDGGVTLDTVSGAGNITFTANNSDLGLKLSGTTSANECAWINVNDFTRID
jgi:hypothetical protein